MAAVADWTFEGTWPYEARWFDSRDGRMHYAKVTKLDDAGHYLQEDAHERIVPELVRFVGALSP